MKLHQKKLKFGVSVFISLLLLSFAWATIVPLRLQADESAHAVNAAGVVRGQMIVEGEKVIYKPTGSPIIEHKVTVPSSYVEVQDGAICLIKRPDVPDSCVEPIPDSSASTAEVFTPAANYPPLYYLLTGWPTLFLDGAAAWLAVRFLTGILCSILLTVGVVSFANAYGRFPALAALAVITPTSLSYAGAINPAGPEIAGCFALAALLAPVITHRLSSPARLIGIGVTVAFAIAMRPTSILWVALVVLLALIMAPLSLWSSLIKRKSFWGCIAISVLGTLGGILWYKIARPGESILGWASPDMTFKVMLKKMAQSAWLYWESIIGNFGWVDNPVPAVLQILAVVLFAAIFVYALKYGNIQEKVSVVLGLLAFPVAAIGIQYSLLPTAGIMWQGRYWLPLIAGYGVLCLAVIFTRKPADLSISKFLLMCFAFLHVHMFFQVAVRYIVGLGNPLSLGNFTLHHVIALVLGLCGFALLLSTIIACAREKQRNLKPSPALVRRKRSNRTEVQVTQESMY